MTCVSFRKSFLLTFVLLLMAISLGASNATPGGPMDQVNDLTRSIGFDYVSWTVNAIGLKLGQLFLGTAGYMPEAERSGTVLAELDLIRQINQIESQLNLIYADPKVMDPEAASADLRSQLRDLQHQKTELEPLAEAILQEQVSQIATQAGLTLGGQAIPPVLYHTTPPPDALIISPRNIIQQDQDISISPDITVDQMDALEKKVDQTLNVSSLVVGIGGIGVYPTMVMETTDINGLLEVVAHEWIHNYLTLRPLGFSYMNSSELRTMNETVASIAGKELGRMAVDKYYHEYLPPPPTSVTAPAGQSQESSPPVFNFNAEMHITRMITDRLLSEGKIEAAERYMELRRQFLWDNGYTIRKLNQAYFAFYGAYADQPGGAAGADPVGAAVRLLRGKSSSLADFINRIAWMWKFDQLEKAVGSG